MTLQNIYSLYIYIYGFWLHSLYLTTPAGQRWLGGASHLSTFGWFHLHDIGCLESARWVTPTVGATIVCTGLVVYRSMQELAFLQQKELKCLQPGVRLLAMASGMWQGSSVQSAPTQRLIGVRQLHMLAFGQTWQSASAAAQCAVGAGQLHMLAFGQPSVSSGFPLPVS